MPIYTYQCRECGAIGEEYRRIESRHDCPACQCGGATQKLILPALVRPDLPEYVSIVSGKLVSGRKQREEDLKRTGCRPYEGRASEEREAARQRAYAEEKDSARLEDAAHRAYNELPPSVRRAMDGGV